MGSVEVSPEGALKKEKVDLNFIMQDANKQVRENGVAGAKQALSEEEESRLNEDAEDVNARERDTRAQSHASAQKRQQQPLGPVVRWERFLSLRSLKVLLVENDDSTRQVVSALLRNCSYEVTAATNGLQAWRILEDSTYHVDLVLTEVVLPCLTGVGLLCKIMSHKTCKNIPVIMMSSHDSMGIVFKCLSRGAVDFLVKPIRKNELKNLWQHVWRRCHSSSGSESESGIQTRNSPQSKSVDGSDNNTGSNDEDDNASIGLNNRDGSDNGSATQSSWTKRAVDVDSPKLVSPWDQLTEPRNSICAHVIHPGTETLCSEQLPASKEWGCKDRKELLDNTEMGKDLEIGVLQNRDNVPEQGLVVKEQKYEGALTLEIFNSTYSEVQAQPVNLTGSIANNSNVALMEMGPSETPNGPSKIPEIRDKPIADTKESPFIDMSLKTLRSTGERGISQHDEQNGLRHSVLSAFSRYNTATSAAQALIGCGRNFSFPLDSISEAVKKESVYNFASDSNAALVNHGSYGSSNNDMGSTTKNAFTKPAIVKDSSASTSTAKCVTHSSSAFHPVHQCHNFPTQRVITENTNDMALAATENQLRGGHHQVQVQHHHYHYHHHRHHVHNISLKNMAAVAPQCGSSTEPMEGNGNYNINESASGSNHESNRQNGSSTDVNNGGMNMESDNGAAGKSASGWGGSSEVDQNRLSQREAALSKFRQKRKERCFEKKVRYQSRKKLAEQRPRMRGQFVRQIVYQHTSEDTDC